MKGLGGVDLANKLHGGLVKAGQVLVAYMPNITGRKSHRLVLPL